MKKLLSVLVLVGIAFFVSAQHVSETVTLYGKEQLHGFTITIPDATSEIAEGAMVQKLENDYRLKGKKNKGYHTYMSQSCSVFGDQNYDIYFTTKDVGKKKNRSAQVIFVVSTGNQNCITMAKDPITARSIMSFLENFKTDVDIYKVDLKIDELNKQLETLNKEKQSLEKEQIKIKDKLTKTNADLQQTTRDIEVKNSDITKLQAEYTTTHNPETKYLIDKTAKEAQTLQKSQTSMRKSLLNLNNNLQKVGKKIDENAREIDKVSRELTKVKRG